METMDPNVTLRPATDDDEGFLYSVYAGTRADEVAMFGWDEAQKHAFLRMQFTLQHRSYKMQYPNAEHSIILFDRAPAGRMIVDRTFDLIQLTDIAVLAGHQKKGIATGLIRGLQSEAAAAGKPLVLHVDRQNNTARALYEKLGFTITGETQLLYEMEWSGAAT